MYRYGKAMFFCRSSCCRWMVGEDFQRKTSTICSPPPVTEKCTTAFQPDRVSGIGRRGVRTITLSGMFCSCYLLAAKELRICFIRLWSDVLWEPPSADPHPWWCGGWGLNTPGYPISKYVIQKKPLHFHVEALNNISLLVNKRNLALTNLEGLGISYDALLFLSFDLGNS